MPGIFAIHSSGRPHQISRASATAASAPPNRLPSLRRNCISRLSCVRDKPSNAPTRGSCSGARAIPRFSRIGTSHRAMRVQNLQSASKKSQPRACRPFPSVYSLTSEIMISPLPLSRGLFPIVSKKCDHLAAQFHNAFQSSGWHADDLLKQAGHRGQKFQHTFQPLASVRIALRIGFYFLHAFREHAQRRIDLPPLALLGNNAENLPHVFNRHEVVTPVAQDVYHADDAPPL